ncbi:Adenosine (5')-pentaphospho-(5'')-adenosine pyrophosphohydrolase [hydrothermal vent metagenome]|uniref:Adenosine (5')-pentaphospho-(5'')-adenosine pyrophosphohydrolase n=1 Tax=hydrothermal vent metagenome TaxID=652676 RepID=A0A3B0R369_9ZZZZ
MRNKVNLDNHRPNAAIVLFNQQGQVFVGRRAGETGKHCWQFPQGGIDAGEKPLAAAYRELKEETGIKRKHVQLLGKIKGWLPYDFPDDINIARNKRKRWDGQKQKWFAMRFSGKKKHIKLDKHLPVEFDKWAWVDLADTPQMTIKWKRESYRIVVEEFTRFVGIEP